MGAGRLETIVDLLMANGRAPETPVAAVRWGTRAEQSTTRATLATIAALGVASPSAIVVGPVAGLDLAWFEARPLFGRRIVVTRAREQASALRDPAGGARRRGHRAADDRDRAAAASRCPTSPALAWLVFTSANGVDGVLRRVASARRGLDARALGAVRVAAIGPGTAAALARVGIRPDLVPERFVAESLLEAFPPALSRRAGAPRPGRAGARRAARGARAARLRASTCCRCTGPSPPTPDPDELDAGPRRRRRRDHVHVVVDRHQLLRPRRAAARIPRRAIVSIGPITSDTAARSGASASTAEADPHTIDGLVAALLATLVPPVVEPDARPRSDLDR